MSRTLSSTCSACSSLSCESLVFWPEYTIVITSLGASCSGPTVQSLDMLLPVRGPNAAARMVEPVAVSGNVAAPLPRST